MGVFDALRKKALPEEPILTKEQLTSIDEDLLQQRRLMRKMLDYACGKDPAFALQKDARKNFLATALAIQERVYENEKWLMRQIYRASEQEDERVAQEED